MHILNKESFLKILNTYNIDYDVKDDGIYVYYLANFYENPEYLHNIYNITDELLLVNNLKSNTKEKIDLINVKYFKKKYHRTEIEIKSLTLFVFYYILPSSISSKLFGRTIDEKSMEKAIRVYKINNI